jgi:hypothetical protein
VPIAGLRGQGGIYHQIHVINLDTSRHAEVRECWRPGVELGVAGRSLTAAERALIARALEAVVLARVPTNPGGSPAPHLHLKRLLPTLPRPLAARTRSLDGNGIGPRSRRAGLIADRLRPGPALLSDEETGQPVADHQLDLDLSADEYAAFTELYRYVRWRAVPDRRVTSETGIVDRAGA